MRLEELHAEEERENTIQLLYLPRQSLGRKYSTVVPKGFMLETRRCVDLLVNW